MNYVNVTHKSRRRVYTNKVVKANGSLRDPKHHHVPHSIIINIKLITLHQIATAMPMIIEKYTAYSKIRNSLFLSLFLVNLSFGRKTNSFDQLSKTHTTIGARPAFTCRCTQKFKMYALLKQYSCKNDFKMRKQTTRETM